MSIASKASQPTNSGFDVQTERDTAVEAEANALDDMVTVVVTFLIASVVGLVILNEFYSSIDTSSGPFNSTFDDVESTTTSVYGLLLVLPLIAVGAMAIGILNKRMGGGR